MQLSAVTPSAACPQICSVQSSADDLQIGTVDSSAVGLQLRAMESLASGLQHSAVEPSAAGLQLSAPKLKLQPAPSLCVFLPSLCRGRCLSSRGVGMEPNHTAKKESGILLFFLFSVM
jgi:hypothetical protein